MPGRRQSVGRPHARRGGMTNRATGLFVTATDTGAGKTVVSATLLAGLAGLGIRAAGMKPVATGCAPTPHGLRNPDAELLMRYAGIELPYEQVNPFAFEPAVAPHIAARSEGVELSLPTIVRTYDLIAAEAQAVVVEGIGGWRVPLGIHTSCADLATMLDLPVVLVVGIRLGCINQALLTAEAIARDGRQLVGWIANRPQKVGDETRENASAIADRVGAPMLADLPWMSDLDPTSLVSHLQQTALGELFPQSVPTS